MLGRIAVSAYCHSLILGRAAASARDVADRVLGELFPALPEADRQAILDHEIAAVEPRGTPT